MKIPKAFQNSKVTAGIKIVLFGIFAFYLGNKWSEFTSDDSASHFAALYSHTNLIAWTILFFALFALNWSMDTLIWWIVIRKKVQVSFKEALKINLISHAVGLATPGKIGEYGIRSIHFSKLGKIRQSFLLTLSYRVSKFVVNLGVGLLAGAILLRSYSSNLSSFLAFALVGLIIFIWFIPKFLDLIYHSALGRWIFGPEEVRNWHFSKREFLTSLFPALIKFLSYSSQLAILIYLGTQLPIAEALSRSISVYSLSSFIPTLSIFDPLVRTAIGDWVFQSTDTGLKWITFSILIVWSVNVAIPALFGYFLWFRMKPHTSKEM